MTSVGGGGGRGVTMVTKAARRRRGAVRRVLWVRNIRKVFRDESSRRSGWELVKEVGEFQECGILPLRKHFSGDLSTRFQFLSFYLLAFPQIPSYFQICQDMILLRLNISDFYPLLLGYRSYIISPFQNLLRNVASLFQNLFIPWNYSDLILSCVVPSYISLRRRK